MELLANGIVKSFPYLSLALLSANWFLGLWFSIFFCAESPNNLVYSPYHDQTHLRAFLFLPPIVPEFWIKTDNFRLKTIAVSTNPKRVRNFDPIFCELCLSTRDFTYFTPASFSCLFICSFRLIRFYFMVLFHDITHAAWVMWHN